MLVWDSLSRSTSDWTLTVTCYWCPGILGQFVVCLTKVSVSKFHITAYGWRVNTFPSMLPYLKTTCLLTRLLYLKTTHQIQNTPSKLLYNCYLIWKSTMMLERDRTCYHHTQKRAEYIGNSHLFRTIPATAISSITESRERQWHT